MFHYLTQSIQEPFLRPELVDKLACMLDAVLEQMNNVETYSWGPKWMLSHLIDIYLHLDSDKLANAIANDQVSYLSISLTESIIFFLCRDLSNWKPSMRQQSDWKISLGGLSMTWRSSKLWGRRQT